VTVFVQADAFWRSRISLINGLASLSASEPKEPASSVDKTIPPRWVRCSFESGRKLDEVDTPASCQFQT
jgi:hypothetical protein